MPKYRVNLTDEEGLNGNVGEFVASSPEGAVLQAKEKFGPDFPVVVEVVSV
jgi:hypothetical protein